MTLKGVFVLPTRAELRRAAMLSLIATALCLLWPLAALAQDVATGGPGAAINVDLGTGSGRMLTLLGKKARMSVGRPGCFTV